MCENESRNVEMTFFFRVGASFSSENRVWKFVENFAKAIFNETLLRSVYFLERNNFVPHFPSDLFDHADKISESRDGTLNTKWLTLERLKLNIWNCFQISMIFCHFKSDYELLIFLIFIQIIILRNIYSTLSRAGKVWRAELLEIFLN